MFIDVSYSDVVYLTHTHKSLYFVLYVSIDAILPKKGPIIRAMSKRLQEDWARAAEEGPRVLMNLRVDF